MFAIKIKNHFVTRGSISIALLISSNTSSGASL